MGIETNITHTRFPAQGSWLGRRTRVCFHFDLAHQCLGTIVREDEEPPGVLIIRLDDGRHVLSTECQYSPIEEEEHA